MQKTPTDQLSSLENMASMLSLSLCFSFLFCSCSAPTKIFSNAEVMSDENNSTIKGMFVFGSSLFDNGNNNFLDTNVKADYLPCGIDFQNGPSGRFSNGKTFIDALGEILNISAMIPPFNDPSTKGNHTAVGVNYACSGSGILDDIAGGVPSLNEQIKIFEEVTLPEFEKQGENSSRESLSKYLFVVGSGADDYDFHYFLNESKSKISIKAFTDNLIATLSSQLKKLHSLGAQKFVVLALYPLGCSPRGLAAQPQKKKGCNKSLNNAALDFNYYLKSLVKRIKPEMPGSELVMVNAYNIIEDITKYNSDSEGFTDTTQPCCQVPSKAEGGNGVLCKKGGSTCEDRNKFVYFDAMHPTEAVNVELAKEGFSSRFASYVYPFNIKKLVEI